MVELLGSNDGVWDWELGSESVTYAPGFRKLLGFEGDDTRGLPDYLESFASRIHEQERQSVWAAVNLALQSRQPFVHEFRLRHKNDDYVWVRCRASASYDETGAAMRMVGSIYDITSQKESERRVKEVLDELRKLNAELNQSNQDLERFAFAASHDLQEPLRAISGFVQLLQQKYDGQLDAQAKGYIDKTVEGVNRMAQVINGLLNYSRVGNESINFEMVDLDLVMKSALGNLSESVMQTSATIDVAELPTISGSHVLLTQLMQNLISNAIKYKSARPPEIKIWCRLTGGGVKLYFEDNGIGIPEDYKEQIFGLFKRLHHRTEYPGTGLGLAIVKRIVERHKGTVHVEDARSGEGSLFIVELRH
jgi:PAS domain S-box-containing protein